MVARYYTQFVVRREPRGAERAYQGVVELDSRTGDADIDRRQLEHLLARRLDCPADGVRVVDCARLH